MGSWKAKTLHILLFTFVIIMFLLGYGNTKQMAKENDSVELSTGWKVKINDAIYENADLSILKFNTTNRGDWLVMSRTLPSDITGDITMSIKDVYSVVQIYVDGTKFYEYGMEDYEQEKFIGYGNLFVTLPDDCAGKELKMTMYVTEDNAFTSIQVPVLYNTSTVFVNYYRSRIIPLAVAVTLIVVGISITLVTFCLYFKSYSMERLFCVGVFSMCIGFWSLCSYNLSDIFSNSLRIKTFFEFFALFLVLFPLLLYFREEVEERQQRWECFIYYALLFVEILMYILVVIAQATNEVHMVSFSNVFQIYMVVAVLFILWLIIMDALKDRSHLVLTVAFAVLTIIALRDVIAFNLSKYSYKFGTEHTYKSYIAAGALIYVVAMLADFILVMRKKMFATAETQFLEKIAYVDVLTDLFTRRKCEEIFEFLDRQANPYILIQFDLNDLKRTNDTYGHEEGDALLTRFANCLKRTFFCNEILGRMGGDEFIAIIKDVEGYDVEGRIKFLKNLMSEDNEGNKVVQLSAAIGYCSSTEFSHPIANAVYKEADKRMYRDKEEYYRLRGYGRRRSD